MVCGFDSLRFGSWAVQLCVCDLPVQQGIGFCFALSVNAGTNIRKSTDDIQNIIDLKSSLQEVVGLLKVLVSSIQVLTWRLGSKLAMAVMFASVHGPGANRGPGAFHSCRNPRAQNEPAEMELPPEP